MSDYTLEETKNMSRALRHADYAAFRGMLKGEERFTPWLDAIENNAWERIHFEWLDAQWIKVPQNDVESIVISAIGDGLIENKNWPVAYNCLMRLPDSTKAQRKRAQVLENYIKTKPRPSESIETAYLHAALSFYENDHDLPEDLRTHHKAYYDLALQGFEESALKKTLQENTFHEDIRTPLDAIKQLIDNIDSKNWENVGRAAQRMTHPLDEAGVYAWLVWFSECIQAGASEKTAALIFSWSTLFWPLVRDPLHFRAKVLCSIPDAAELMVARDYPERYDELKAATDDAFPESFLLYAMLTDNSQKVIQMAEERKKLSQNSIVAGIIDTWLDIMDAPDHLAQTTRTALRAHPTNYCICPQFFSHALVAQNERVEIARNLFSQGDDAVILLIDFPKVTADAFDDDFHAYIGMMRDAPLPYDVEGDGEQNDAAGKEQTKDSNTSLAIPQKTPLVKHKTWRIVGWMIVIGLSIYTIVSILLFLISIL